MNIKAIAFDMDGTLLKKDQTINFDNIKAIQEASKQGIKIILASGRPYKAILSTAKILGCVDLIVANNGSCLFDIKRDKFFNITAISVEFFHKLRKIAKETKSLFALHTQFNAYREIFFNLKDAPEWATESFNELNSFSPAELINDSILTEPITQLSLKNDKAEIKRIADELKSDKANKNLSVHISNEVYLDINPKDTSKLTGIQKVIKHYNINIKDVMVFGDSGNDIQMIQGCGLGIAMENSTQELKDLADEVIGHHETNAIAKKILEEIS